MSNVKVAVRVRPLTKREEEQGAKIVVAVEGDSIRVTNLKQASSYQEHDSRTRLRQFVFDFCYWSADGSKRSFASQEMIYEDLGTKVLDAVFEGFNACVLAYGQSGSGKTYTMMGYNGDRGLTPRICQGLFDRMSRVEDKRVTFRTEVSFLEIYNERVGDLLRTAPCRRQRHALRVREHPKLGPCVQDLSKHVVTDFNAVQALIERGIQNRSVAATKMHDHSSRSHAIFTINFTQARVDEELPSEVVSKIHLVDLAGSERATVHMSKIRLKEGANINKSLVALGGVICALAEKSMSQWSLDSLSSSRSHANNPGESVSISSSPMGSSHRGQQTFIPYRDSVLTWLLKDSLGGNSKTIMVATISPASTAYNETISTLRYTQRAKRIVNKPVVNEDPNVKLIRELKAEITRLRGMLANSQASGLLELPAEKSMPVAEIILRNQDKAQELTKMWIEKWHDFQKQVQELSCKTCIHRNNMGNLADCGTPYLVGVSDLPSAGVHIFYLKEGDMIIGNCTKNGNAPDIILMGEQMATEHCRLNLQEGTATITPIDASECLLNGNSISSPAKLNQGDVVQLGKNNTLKFVDSSQCVENLETRNGKDLAIQEILALPGVQRMLTDLPNSNTLPEDTEKTFLRRCSGLQVLENFNKILEMKFHSPANCSVKCPACSQPCEWADDGTASQPKNSPDDSGIGDTEMSCNTEANLDSFTDNDGFQDDAPNQRPGPMDLAPEYSGKSEGEEYDDWSDADDFSYFAFDDGKAMLDKQQNVAESHSQTTDHETYSQHMNYLTLPMQSLVSRRLSPIQECDTRSPSPAHDQSNAMADHVPTSTAILNNNNNIPLKSPMSSEQKFGIPGTNMQVSVEAQETLSSSEQLTEIDGSISCDSLDADSLDNREENASCDSESVFCALMLPAEMIFTGSNSDFPLVNGGADTIKQYQTNIEQEMVFRPESRDKRANSIAAFPHHHPEATFSDTSSGRPMAASWSTPMLTKSGNLHQRDRGLRQKCGYSSSSEDEQKFGRAGRNQKLCRNDSSRTPNLVRFLREKSCDTYTSSSEDESCQQGMFGKPQIKSLKAKQRFEKIVLENKRKKRRKTAPKKGKQKTCSPMPKTSEFILPQDRCTSPPPLPKLEFNKMNIIETFNHTKDDSVQTPKRHSNSPETIKDSVKIWNTTPIDRNCFHAASAEATNSSGVIIDQKSDRENQTCIPVVNGDWNQDLYKIVQLDTDSDSIFDHVKYSDSLLSCDNVHGLSSYQDLDQTVQSGNNLDSTYDHAKEPDRCSIYEISHSITSHQDPVQDHTAVHCRAILHDCQHDITLHQDLDKTIQLNADVDNIFESKKVDDANIYHVSGQNSYQNLDEISQLGTELDSTINHTKNHDRFMFCDSDQDMISDLTKNQDQIPLQGIDADRTLLCNEDLAKISATGEEWLGGKQPGQLLQSILDEDEMVKIDKCPDEDEVSERSGMADHSFPCSSFMFQDPCIFAHSDTPVDQDSDRISNTTEHKKLSTPNLDCSSSTFETRTAIKDFSRYDHPLVYVTANPKSEISHNCVDLFDGEMSENDTSQSLHILGFVDEAQTARITPCREYSDNSSHELEVFDRDFEPSELTCWSNIAARQHELSDQLHISMHSKPSEKGLFGSSSSIWGQSWPSCDSLTMVYMGPEWGSTETNMIASIQSLEDLNDSDFSEGHQEALERFVAKSMQARQNDSPKRFQNAFAAPSSYHSSSDSMAFNNDCCKNSNETFTICSTDDPMAAIWERQYADSGSMANEPIAAGLARATYADEWTKDTRPYKDLWTIHSYSVDDLQSHSSCLCKGMHNTANSCCNEAGNMSMGSTCTAEVSTQTESDSGIQTDATVQSDATQTSITYSSLGTQSVPAYTSATSQTAPLQIEVHVQTDPVRCEAGSQTLPAVRNSSSQSRCPENKGVQTFWAKGEVCIQTERHCIDANTNTECNTNTSGIQTKTSCEQETQITDNDPREIRANLHSQSDRYVEIPTMEPLKKNLVMETALSDMILLAEIDHRENILESGITLPDLKCIPEMVALDSERTDGESVLKKAPQNANNSLEAVLLSETKLPNWKPTPATEVSKEKHVNEALLEDRKPLLEAVFSEEGLSPSVEMLEKKLAPVSLILDDEHAAEKIPFDNTFVQEPLLLEEKVLQEVLLSEENMAPNVMHLNENLLQETVDLDKKTRAILEEIIASEAMLLEQSFEHEMVLLNGLLVEEKCAPEPALPDEKLAPKAEPLPSKMFAQNQISPNGEYASETRPSDNNALKQDKEATTKAKPASRENFSGIQLPLFQSGIYVGFHGNAHQVRILDMKIILNETADNVTSAPLSLQQDSNQRWNSTFSENPAPEYKCVGNASKELPIKSQVITFVEKDFADAILTGLDMDAVEEPKSLETTKMSTKPEAVLSQHASRAKSNEDVLKHEDVLIETAESMKSKEKIIDLEVIPLEKCVSSEITETLALNENLAESEIVILQEETNETDLKSEAVLVDVPRSMEISKEFEELKVSDLENTDYLKSMEKPPESVVELLADNYGSLETNQACAETDEAEDSGEKIRLQDVGETSVLSSTTTYCSTKDKGAGTCLKQTSTENLFENVKNFQCDDKPCGFSSVRDTIVGLQKTCFCQDHNLGDVDDREVALWSKPDTFFNESLMEYFDGKFHSLENAVKASELELREFSQRFTGNQEDGQISTSGFSMLPEDSTNQRSWCDNRPQNCKLHESFIFLDPNAGIRASPENDERTLGQIKCDNYIDAESESVKQTETKTSNLVLDAPSEDPKNEESECDLVLQKARKCQTGVSSDPQVRQLNSKTSYCGQRHDDIDSCDEEYYKFPNVGISQGHRKHRLSSKGAVPKPIQRENTETRNKMLERQRSAQRRCRKSATKALQTEVPQRSDSGVKQETVPKDVIVVETKPKSETALEVRQTLEESREVPCSVTKQGTGGETPRNCPRNIKCTCDLQETPQQPIVEVNSDAEQTVDDLPEDIVQLLRECRMVRKKAWKEIALAHRQLSITRSTSKRNACAVHRMDSFEGS